MDRWRCNRGFGASYASRCLVLLLGSIRESHAGRLRGAQSGVEDVCVLGAVLSFACDAIVSTTSVGHASITQLSWPGGAWSETPLIHPCKMLVLAAKNSYDRSSVTLSLRSAAGSDTAFTVRPHHFPAAGPRLVHPPPDSRFMTSCSSCTVVRTPNWSLSRSSDFSRYQEEYLFRIKAAPARKYGTKPGGIARRAVSSVVVKS